MKTLQAVGLVGVALLAAGLTSCQRDSGVVEPTMAPALNEKPTASQPQIAYVDVTAVRKADQQGTPVIKVMDANGSHQSTIYKAPSASAEILGGPSWASSGTGTVSSPWQLAFAEKTSAGSVLKVMGLYCNSTGVPTATAASTLATINDGRVVGGVAWRPGTDEIAFASRRQLGTSYWQMGAAEIYVANRSGVVTRIYPSSGEPSPSTSTFTVAWSPTGDTVAFDLHENVGNDGDVYNDVNTVVLMRRDGTLLGQYGYADSIKKFSGITGLDWSRDGTLALSAWSGSAMFDSLGNQIGAVAGPNRIFTLDAATGVFTPYFQATQPSWSPDATAFVYQGLSFLGGGIQVRTLTSSTSTVLATSGSRPAWR